MAKKILLAEIMHESNTFNRRLTTRADFASRYLLRGDEIPEALAGTNTEIWGFLTAARSYGWQVTHPLAASANPSGPMAVGEWRAIRQEILAPLEDGQEDSQENSQESAQAFDAVVLVLHGAMVTEDSDDPDGDLLTAVRALVGPEVPVVATLDMHANVSARMADAANLLMAYRTYPHVDQQERGAHMAWLLAQIFEKALEPRCFLARRPMLDAADHGQTGDHSKTGVGPMAGLLAEAAQVERLPGVLCASLQIGFPWADVPCIGPSVAVSGHGPALAEGQGYAEALMARLWDSRKQTRLHFPRPEEAMAKARLGRPGDGPLILADFADNPAGGAYGDSPNLLRAMIEARLPNGAFAAIADPAAVAKGREAGVGVEIDLELGGWADPGLTPPLALRGRVMRLSDGKFTCEGPMWQGVAFSMGPTMVLQVEGVEIIVCSHPTAVMDLQVFRSQGIEPAAKTTIGLKSRNHFRAAYGPLARETMLVDAGGAASMRLKDLPYRKIPRPIWPLDLD